MLPFCAAQASIRCRNRLHIDVVSARHILKMVESVLIGAHSFCFIAGGVLHNACVSPMPLGGLVFSSVKRNAVGNAYYRPFTSQVSTTLSKPGVAAFRAKIAKKAPPAPKIHLSAVDNF